MKSYSTFPYALVVLTFGLSLEVPSAALAAVRYVDSTASGSNDGTSWVNAYVNLQSAISASSLGDEIWVASGTYKPAIANGDRNLSFLLKDQVPLYGGFPQGGSVFEDRDPSLNLTILSGDLNGNDGPPGTFLNNGENSYHVLRNFSSASTVRIDGFVIEGGHANGTDSNNRGGGIEVSGSSISIYIHNCVVRDNFATQRGGGAYLAVSDSASPNIHEIMDCAFVRNALDTGFTSVGEGAGLYGSGSSVSLIHTIFELNTGSSGGGAYLDALYRDMLVFGCEFEANTVKFQGGGLYVTGSSSRRATIRDCAFKDNATAITGSSTEGGGLYVKIVRLDLVGSQFVNNIARSAGGGAWLDPYGSYPATIINCDFRGNQSTTNGGGGLYYQTNANVAHFIQNCLFTGNSCATSGGAILINSSASGLRQVINCTISGNSAGTSGGGIAGVLSNVSIANSVVWENSDSSGSGQSAQIGGTPLINYTAVSGWTGSLGGVGNNGLDPMFIDSNGPDNIVGNEDDDLRLLTGSPAIDSGDKMAIGLDLADADFDGNVTENVPVDLDGIPRIQDHPLAADTGTGAPPHIDRGAYEFGQPLTYVTYIGAPNGNWNSSRNWSSGLVPDADTNVLLTTSVHITSGQLFAAQMLIGDGGGLLIDGGTLDAVAVIVQTGGELAIESANALLETQSLNVQPGGTLIWSAGSIVIDSGGWPSLYDINVGCTGLASLILKNGATVTAPKVQVCSSGLVGGTGTIASNLTNAGKVAPGASAGALIISGTFTQTASGTLQIELGGYGRGTNYDTLYVQGQANLAGTLNVTLLPGFLHWIGETQTLLSAAFVAGTFGTKNIPSLPAGTLFIDQTTSGAFTLLTMLTSTGPRLYVNAAALGGGNGQTWSGAAPTLQGALTVALTFPTEVAEIWVAEGTYKPTKQTDPFEPRTARFQMQGATSLYGSFAGTETSINERDLDKHQTILSGDLNGDDGPNFENTIENVFNVIVALSNGTPPTTVLDGFVVKGGNAAGLGTASGGGGMLINVATPTIRNCTFTKNSAMQNGGGLSCSSNAVVEDCVFINNRTYGGGIGAGARHGGPFPVFRNCWFEANVAKISGGGAGGGGLSCGGTRATVIGCTFVNNVSESSSDGGGGLWCGPGDVINCSFFGNKTRGSGAGLLLGGSTTSVIANCIFSGNSVGVGYPPTSIQQGSGIALTSMGPQTIVNCTFSNNVSAANGGAIYTRAATAIANVSNSIVWGNSNPNGSNQDAQLSGVGPLNINYCNVQGWTGSLGGTGNLSSDPVLANPVGSDATAGTSDDDLRLTSSSPCIDAGANASLPQDTFDLDGDSFTGEPLPVDIELNYRVVDDPLVPDTGSGTPPLVDRGAFEFGSTPAGSIVFIGPSGGSWFVAGNWSNGTVPGPQTNVVINTTVLINSAGALALSIAIQSGGSLVISGSLSAQSVIVLSGGMLQLTDSAALLQLQTLAISNGATFQFNAGTVQVTQSLTSSTNLVFGCNGDATLLLANGATVTVPTIQVCQNGILAGNGTVTANLVNHGLVSPGTSVGVLSVSGTYTQDTDGVLQIEMIGTAPDEIDRIVVSDNATIAGNVTVTVLSTFSPTIGPSTFLTAGQVTGSFESTNLPALPDGFDSFVQYDSLTASVFLVAPGPRLYVNAAHQQPGSGSSWDTATPSLALALIAAANSNGAIDELWVAQGTYKPTSNQMTASFSLLTGVAIYGGFVGNETDLEQRDIETNITTLSGDLNGDDGPNFTNRADNVFHVVKAAGVNSTSVLDGFTVRGGNAAGSFENGFGGGLHCANADPAIRNCIFTSNYAKWGGGVYRTGPPMVVVSCQFIENATESNSLNAGGGFMVSGSSTVTFQECSFVQNSSGDGGGLAIEAGSTAIVQSCEFNNNFVTDDGAAIFSKDSHLSADNCTIIGNVSSDVSEGSAIFGLGGSISLTNCELASNQATNGGALGLALTVGSNAAISSCSFVQNTATQSGGAVYMNPGINVPMNPVFSDCTFADNSAVYRGGAVVALHEQGTSLNPVFNNCTFSGNEVAGTQSNQGQGGALLVTIGIPSTTNGLKLNQCTFNDNVAANEGGAIRVQGATIDLDDCTFDGNDAPVGSAIYNVSVGTVRGNAEFGVGQNLTSANGVRPGLLSDVPPVGALVFDGTLEFIDRGPPYFDQPALHIDVAGTTPDTEFDHINATGGGAALTGALFVNLVNGFTPRAGNEFDIVSSNNISGQFTVALFPVMPPGLLLRAEYTSASVSLVVDPVDNIVSFTDPKDAGVQGSPIAAELGDLDNDGDLDLVICVRAVPPATTGNVYVFLNGGNNQQGDWNGFTSVSSPMPVGVGPVSLALGRFDSDSYLDIAVANRTGNSITKYSNNGTGNGSFGAATTTGVATPTAVASGRFFNSWDDLVITKFNNDVVVQSFTSNGGFAPNPVTLAGAIGSKDVATADLDNDGDSDIAVLNVSANSTIGIHRFNSNTMSFSGAIQYPTSTSGVDLQLDDLNDDGFDDVVASHGGGSASILINQALGDATLAAAVAVPIGTTLSSLATLDIEDDGDQDIVTVIGGGPSALVRLARNDLNGGQTATFSQFSDLIVGENSVLVRAGDLNGDGVDDLVCLDTGDAGAEGTNDTIVASRINQSNIPTCPADVAPTGGDGVVNVADMLVIINSWGPCSNPCAACLSDLNDDCAVNVADLLAVINSWGACP